MSQRILQHPAWYKAITLAERIASLRKRECPIGDVELTEGSARKRFEQWRSQRPFSSGPYFDQRLAIDATSETELRRLLGEPVDVLRQRFPFAPDWLVELDAAFSRVMSNESFHNSPALDVKPMGEFLDGIEPLISQGRHRLHEGVQALCNRHERLPFDPATVEAILLANLPDRLITLLSRTMVLELHVARLRGLLGGSTGEERFKAFIQLVRQRDTMLSILQEYPVLARQLVLRIHQWLTYSLEFLDQLCIDWDTIREMFSPALDPGLLIGAEGGAGDSHREGRSVMIIRFGSGLRVVYKPRSVAVDQHFQELLLWLNECGDHPPFKTLKILNRGSYGWVEFIGAHGCSSSAALRSFYERQGGYLALLYALRATDFHFENVVAAGEHPVLLDLEALFHPVLEFELPEANQLASAALRESVLSVSLLPQRIWSNPESDGIDISGLGATAGQLTPYPIPQWVKSGTDEMRLTGERTLLPAGHNRPSLNGDEVDVLAFSDALLTGFKKVYQLLLNHRHDLMSEDGPLARFAQDQVRVVLRDSKSYAVLSYESFHPDVMRDALDRDRLLDRLWMSVEHHPSLAHVISAEHDDLERGDIPLFTTRPASRDLWTSSNQRIVDFFDAPGLSQAHCRLQSLSEEDLARQLWFISGSLASLAMGEDTAPWPAYRWNEPQTHASRDDLLNAARAVGDRLEALALRGEHDVAWIGLSLIHERHWSLITSGMDLYNGVPGITLFLAYLGAVTGERRYTALAQAASGTITRQIEQIQSSMTSIGAFEGWGGIIYTLAHLGFLWRQPGLLAQAEKLVQRLATLIANDEAHDVMSGATGCIGGLLSLHRCAPSEHTMAAAVQCGDHLIATAQKMEHGVGWSSKSSARPLAGFSHGAAGIAWALLELASETGEERFRTAALSTIVYERSLFSPEHGNWLDLREPDSEPAVNNGQARFPTAWCHGAPGIGLARLQILQHLDIPEIHAEINTALETTLAQGFGRNHSLCHGDLGNIELLVQASRILDHPRWSAQVNRLAAIILESINRHGWLCGVPLGVESPGLMTGLSGIGYGLLRLAEPEGVPSVLVLAPPPISRDVNVSSDAESLVATMP